MIQKPFIILNKKIKPKPSVVFNTYWKFAAKRQEVFFNKILNGCDNQTEDHIISRYKFTNAYRASDRVSQYLIKSIIYEGDQNFEEVFFRTILFKTFNKIDTWILLKNELGDLSSKNFDFKQLSSVLMQASTRKETIYSGAYIMTSGKSIFGYEKKFQNHLKVIELMLKEKVAQKILHSTTLENVFNILKSYPTIGDFLAYQYAIDLNYSSNLTFSEMDFVKPGPGAKDGIRKCFSDYGDYNETEIVKYVTDKQEEEFDRIGLSFRSLWGRRLHLIDCQNLFCEVDKYARIMHPEINGLSNRKRIKQLYSPAKTLINYWYPPKWNINNKINSEYGKRKKRIHQSLQQR